MGASPDPRNCIRQTESLSAFTTISIPKQCKCTRQNWMVLDQGHERSTFQRTSVLLSMVVTQR
jgi:hypothetical protein